MSSSPHTVVLFHYFRCFLQEAAKHRIDIAPLKGAHLLTSVYPETEERGPMCDLDFLVRPEQWDAALAVLRNMGFVQRSLSGRPVTQKHHYEASFLKRVSKDASILFEPHRYLIQPSRVPVDYDALWDRSSPSTFDGAPCRRLCVEDHILHAVVHLTTHFFTLPQSWMRDVDLLVQVGRPDMGVLADRARAWGVQRPMRLMAELLAENGFPETAAACSVPALPAAVREALRFLVPDCRGFRFPTWPLRAKEAVLWPLLMDSFHDFRRFSLSYAVLRWRDLLGRFFSSEHP